MRIADILKLDGMKTFLWFDELDKNEAKPSGVSRSKLMNTGLAVVPLANSTLNILPSTTSPELELKWFCQRDAALSAISPLV